MWIVSYFDDICNGNITVTAFDNYDAAYAMYEYEYEKHYIVSIDEVTVYSKFFSYLEQPTSRDKQPS